MKSLALLAFVLALGLLGWRAMTVLTAPQSQTGASALERTTLSLVETVTGPGHARVSITHGAAGKVWLVLLDGAPGTISETAVSDLVKATGSFEAGRDTLNIQQYAFATGASARPDTAAIAELAILGLLTALLAYLGFAPQRSPAVAARPEAAPQAEPAMPAPRVSKMPAPDAQAATNIAAADPATAATVLRGWMNGEGGNA